MRIYLFLFTIIVLQNLPSQEIAWDSIQVINLEEDKGPFATYNDELILISGVYSPYNDSLLYWQTSEQFILSDSIPTGVLDFYNNFSSEDYLIIVMMIIELDQELEESDLEDTVLNVFAEYRNFPSTLTKEKIRISLGDDDLLYYGSFTPKQIKKLKSPLICKGMHLFNRYEYRIHFHK